jgi:RES domain-containing protein
VKLSRLGKDTPLFRAHNPSWSHTPLSGAGAARAGGRFNRPGCSALYLSLDQATSAAEYQQDNELTEPYLQVAYVANLPDLVDLRLLDDEWDELWKDWDCDWRQLYVDGNEPPTWLLFEMLVDSNATGLIFPSIARKGGINVVLYTDALDPAWLVVHDPNNLLPKDQSSWK